MMKNRKYIKIIRNVVILLTILLIIVTISFGKTYSNFIYKSNNHRAVEMIINKLNYTTVINDINTSKISISSGNSVINLKIKSNNEVDTYFKLLYVNNPSINIYYMDDLPYGTLVLNEERNIKLFISNLSNDNIDIEFNVSGGYITNELDSVIIPSNCSEITRQIKVGDYVSYIPNGVYNLSKYSLNKIYSGYDKDQDIYLQKSNYRIFNINNNGTIDIISENDIYVDNNNTKLYFESSLGYNNGINILDDIVKKLYGSSKYSIDSRNVNINDIIDKLESSYEYKYQDIDYKNIYYPNDVNNLFDIISDEYSYGDISLNEHYYLFNTSENNFKNKVHYELLISNKNYWIAGEYINCYDNPKYGLYAINNDITLNDLYDSLNNSYNVGYAIRPIITLASNNTFDYVDGNWILK